WTEHRSALQRKGRGGADPGVGQGGGCGGMSGGGADRIGTLFALTESIFELQCRCVVGQDAARRSAGTAEPVRRRSARRGGECFFAGSFPSTRIGGSAERFAVPVENGGRGP